jgi:hypothetical protein
MAREAAVAALGSDVRVRVFSHEELRQPFSHESARLEMNGEVV